MYKQEAFHPEKSKVSEEKMADFLRAPITGDLLEVRNTMN
jgi:hypothetical protein